MHTSARLLVLALPLALACSEPGASSSADMAMSTGNLLLSGGDCPVATGPGTQHQGDLVADETWTAAASPHVITFDVRVRGATLTIEPCAVVRLKEGYGISIGDGIPNNPEARLIARGTTDGGLHPILLTSFDPTTYWGTLAVYSNGRAELENLALVRAGNPSTAQNFGGALMIFGDDNRKRPVPSVHALHLVIEASASLGINIQRSGGFTADSGDVVIQNSGKAVVGKALETTYAMYVQSPSVQTIPPGRYTGNARDAILVPDPGLDGDETFHERGVPYRLRDSYGISPAKSAAQGGLATLTIEAGVTLKLLKQVGNVPAINLGISGAATPDSIWPVRLVAAGTPAQPIRITSDADAPAPGDWGGIEWSGAPASGNVVSNVILEYGGGDSSTLNFGCGPVDNDALLIIKHWVPSADLLSSCTFSHSASGAIVSGWVGTGPNLRPGNTFIDIAQPCQVTQPTPPTNGCPSNRLTPDCY